jgi:ribose/xylose/arabinose/galactoside ABC-type transport system permease subunit
MEISKVGRSPAPGQPRAFRRLLRVPEVGLSTAVVLAFVFFAALDRSMLQSNYFPLIFSRAAVIGFAAVGMSVLMLAGEIDLSTGAVASFSLMVYNLLGGHGWSELTSLLGALMVAAIIGWVNSVLVLEVRLPSFLATLSTYIIVSGLPVLVHIQPGAGRLSALAWLGNASPVLGIPWSFFALLAMVIIGDLIVRRTRLGPLLWATGANPQAAETTGINTAAVKTLCFMFASVCATVGAYFVLATMNLAPQYGEEWEVWVPAIAIIGGARLSGGAGTVWGALLGTLLLLVIRTGLWAANLGNNAQGVIVGGILVTAIIIDAVRAKVKKY